MGTNSFWRKGFVMLCARWSALHQNAACRPGGPLARRCREGHRCVLVGLRLASVTSPAACATRRDQPIPATHPQPKVQELLDADNHRFNTYKK